MIEISIPRNNIEERSYVLKLVFDTFLGLPYNLIITEKSTDYIISFYGKSIVVKDAFFSRYSSPLSYMAEENLPTHVLFTTNPFVCEKDIPVIYGTEYVILENKDKVICGIDLFSSIFFMVTRWEEYVISKRDMHKRFSARESLAYKFHFLNRPVVNEYVEMLWNMLLYIGVSSQLRKKRNFQLTMTHDIDFLKYPIMKTIRSSLGDIVKRRKFAVVLRLKYLLEKDPFDTYSWLMDVSERKGWKSQFYFMSSYNANSAYDNVFYLKEKKFASLIHEISQREHIIGFHPSYNSYNNEDLWKEEWNLLTSYVKQPVTEGRQHYLRIELPTTLRIWNDNGMKYDSTLGYADCEGFRCGTGDEFYVFDIISRTEMNLKERPLIVMDGTLSVYQKYSLLESYDCLKYYINISRKYNAQLTLLFHNSSFECIDWPGWKSLYEAI